VAVGGARCARAKAPARVDGGGGNGGGGGPRPPSGCDARTRGGVATRRCAQLLAVPAGKHWSRACGGRREPPEQWLGALATPLQSCRSGTTGQGRQGQLRRPQSLCRVGELGEMQGGGNERMRCGRRWEASSSAASPNQRDGVNAATAGARSGQHRAPSHTSPEGPEISQKTNAPLPAPSRRAHNRDRRGGGGKAETGDLRDRWFKGGVSPTGRLACISRSVGSAARWQPPARTLRSANGTSRTMRSKVAPEFLGVDGA